jgi:Tfp pilus assembly protein FimV
MPAPRRQTLRAIHGGARSHSAGAVLLLAACWLALPAPGHAAQNAPEATQAAPSAPARSYLPKAGETLDQVIARTLPGSPLKIELLRQAFMAQNPQAIMPGKTPKLRKGVPLLVPDHDALLRMHLGSLAAPVEAPTPNARFSPSTSEERKRWVQFP